jgi:alpha-mannosidase
METNVLHFISHSHWDREWYLPFESHRYRMVKLVDDIITTAQNEEFGSFHLDGQVILLEDYLEIKPNRLNELKGLVEREKLIIGPFYILQDEFLVSAEANVRNILIGLKEAEKYGKPCMVGYFPDAFGNIGQMPQILNGFDIGSAVFGRGLNKIGADNKLHETNRLNNSELIWESNDGSSVLGVMFANWYNNANEIPDDEDGFREKCDEIKKKALKYALTPHLLCMNGCDHQPLQKDIYRILQKMQKTTADKLIHSNFNDYIEAIGEYRHRFPVIRGEICGQLTDGMNLLVNTASSKVYIKQSNVECQKLLEKQVEPLAVMAMLHGKNYSAEFIDYAWKTLLKNHPHDSICGCGCDEVSREMITRFSKCKTVGQELIVDAAGYLASRIRPEIADAAMAITVFNPLAFTITENVRVTLDFPEHGIRANEMVSICDMGGNEVAQHIEFVGNVFTYTLPENEFRKTAYKDRYDATFCAKDIPALGYKTFYAKVVPVCNPGDVEFTDHSAENRYLKFNINPNGTFHVTDKQSMKTYENLCYYEDVGDIGDEYNFVPVEQDERITTKNDVAKIKAASKGTLGVLFTIENNLRIPVSTKGQTRSDECVDTPIIAEILFTEYSKRIDIKTRIDNKSCNHRLRAVFPTEIHSDHVYVDLQFEVLRRTIQPWAGWMNPSRTNKQCDFVELTDEKKGIVLSNKGLCEYEILDAENNEIALTLFRSVGEMGDWGNFPTPDAQCLGIHEFEYSFIPDQGRRSDAHKQARCFARNALDVVVQAIDSLGLKEIDDHKSFVRIDGDFIELSAFKKSSRNNDTIMRFYNSSELPQRAMIILDHKFTRAFFAKLNEEELEEIPFIDGEIEMNVPPKKIITMVLKSVSPGLSEETNNDVYKKQI